MYKLFDFLPYCVFKELIQTFFWLKKYMFILGNFVSYFVFWLKYIWG